MADTKKYPRSERTMFPTHHTVPLVGERFDEAKESEKQRKQWDPHYVTADDVATMSPEVQERPEIQQRIEYSRRDWPELKSTATRALGELKPGEGETIDRRTITTEDLFTGSSMSEE